MHTETVPLNCQLPEAPDDLHRVVHIRKCLPQVLWKIDHTVAWLTFLRVWAVVIFSFFLLVNSPPFLVPFTCFFFGTSFFGLFSIMHDCGHYSFNNISWVNDVIGTICGIPLATPWICWVECHNWHHKRTNEIGADVLWSPILKGNFVQLPKVFQALIICQQKFLGFGFGFWVYHVLICLLPIFAVVNPFQWNLSRKRFWLSIFTWAITALGIWFICYFVSFFGSPIKLYFVPLLIYNFWMGTVTYFHHRNPKIQWKPYSTILTR